MPTRGSSGIPLLFFVLELFFFISTRATGDDVQGFRFRV
jgi:hypothetical protein